MAAATSPATGQAYGVKRVCTIWGVARSSFYDARRQDARPPGRPAGRPGPKPALSDAELLAAIRRDLAPLAMDRREAPQGLGPPAGDRRHPGQPDPRAADHG